MNIKESGKNKNKKHSNMETISFLPKICLMNHDRHIFKSNSELS